MLRSSALRYLVLLGLWPGLFLYAQAPAAKTTAPPRSATQHPPGPASASSTPAAPAAGAAASGPGLTAAAIIDTMARQEKQLYQMMKSYHPVVETYIQDFRLDPVLGDVPISDHYYLGQLDYSHGYAQDQTYLNHPGWGMGILSAVSHFYSLHYLSAGFVDMLFPDPMRFDRAHYYFKYLRQDFLGNVRCYVFNVRPKPGVHGAFLGRIWVEARQKHLVRFNGTFVPQPLFSRYFHFDSWRINARPGLWVPAFVYSEESDIKGSTMFGLAGHTRFGAETRIWGYGLEIAHHASTASQMIVEGAVQDRSSGADAYSPVVAERMWQREAEDNVLHRMQKAGLLAPPGPVDKTLEQVVNNLEITNHLNIQPHVRCRVLLVTPMVVFNIGHTIVISRGLVDVLPNEATLATMLAHGLAAIVKGMPIDTKFAFYDRMLIPDDKVFTQFRLQHTPKQETLINTETVQLMQNSPYESKLASVGLFLEAMNARAQVLPHLMGPNFIGNPLIHNGKVQGLGPLLRNAPKLQFANVKQIEALPLGSRLQVQPWLDQVEMFKAPPVTLLSAAEKMPFQVTPQRPYLQRNQFQMAATGSVSATPSSDTSDITH